jgi:hypothetical protein
MTVLSETGILMGAGEYHASKKSTKKYQKKAFLCGFRDAAKTFFTYENRICPGSPDGFKSRPRNTTFS